jgi:pyruvate formate lyase activating enzyme
MTTNDAHTAKWWRTDERGRIVCELCPRYCVLGEGKRGFCFVRRNVGGELKTSAYGKPLGFGVDPIEKKPLNHFLPGTPILSFGTAGCNLGCQYCQNWTSSKSENDQAYSRSAAPEEIVELAKREGCPSIAYTYNDPVVFGEFVIDVAKRASAEDIRSVMVTNGYIAERAREDVFADIDAANVDLKAFSEDFYKRLALASLAPVLETLEWLRRETDVWIELTTLLIPGENDDEDELRRMTDWIGERLGAETPIHFTAFHPSFKMLDTPPTPLETVTNARRIALDAGLKHAYVGNVSSQEGATTYCASCGAALLARNWHSVRFVNLEGDKCGSCGAKLAGVFA